MERKQLADSIGKATDLWELHKALCAFEDALNEDGALMDTMYQRDTEGALNAEGIDICELPTFGGVEPKSTVEVWSWDAEHVLAGVGSFRDWRIEAR